MNDSCININAIFFELLCVAIGTRKALSVTLSAEQWTELFALSKKQALVAVAFTGVTRLNSASDYGASLGIPEVVYLKWLGLTAKIAQRNKQVDNVCVKVSEEFINAGFEPVILKGQGNAKYYPEELRECRNSGDIDIWVGTDRKTAIEYVRPKVQEIEARVHHVEHPEVNGVPVEVHYWPMFMYSFVAQSRFEYFCSKWFDVQWANKVKMGDGVVAIPTPSFNAVFQMLHILRHLFEEGIGLRQLLDYHFVLRALYNERSEFTDRPSIGMWAESVGKCVMSKEELMQEIRQLGMGRFASGLMWVLQEVFATPKEYLLCEPDEVRGKLLLDDVMRGGNFGKYDMTKPEFRTRGRIGMFVYKMKRNLYVWALCPREVIAAPFFRIWHLTWRHLHGYVPKGENYKGGA